jgi:hypothetical protein
MDSFCVSDAVFISDIYYCTFFFYKWEQLVTFLSAFALAMCVNVKQLQK